MKSLIFSILLLSFTSSASTMAEDIPIEFRGLTKIGETEIFSVSNNEGSERAWVSVGDRFMGYTIVEFDPEERILLLQKGDLKYRVLLSNASATAGSVEMEEVNELVQILKAFPLEAQGEQLLLAMTAGMNSFVDRLDGATTREGILKALRHHMWEAALWKDVRRVAWSGLTEEERTILNNTDRLMEASLRNQDSFGPYFDALQELKYDEPYTNDESFRKLIHQLESLGGKIPPRLEER